VDAGSSTTYRYRDKTLVLETDFQTQHSVTTVVDFMPMSGSTLTLSALCEGNVARFAAMELTIRFDYGRIAGMLLPDLILGRDNPWTSLYDPSRKSLRAALTFAEENLNAAGQYAAWMTPGEVGTPEEIKPGTGAVIRRGLSKIAVYRDDAGKLHERSKVCPHLGCIVSWNSTEHSWDCPFHGSRFGPSGKVLSGPAIGSLEKVPHDSSR
jgi:Rieske Fe-S protein